MSGHWNQLCGNVPFQRRDFSERKDWSNLLEWHRYAEGWHSKIDHQHPHVRICITTRTIAVSIFIQVSSAIDKRSSCKATPKFRMLTQMSIWSFIKNFHKNKVTQNQRNFSFLLYFMLMFFFYIFRQLFVLLFLMNPSHIKTTHFLQTATLCLAMPKCRLLTRSCTAPMDSATSPASPGPISCRRSTHQYPSNAKIVFIFCFQQMVSHCKAYTWTTMHHG